MNTNRFFTQLLVIWGLFFLTLAPELLAQNACAPGTCLMKLRTIGEFKSLMKSPEHQVVKIIYNRRPLTPQKSLMYFINTKKFDYHLDFVEQSLRLSIDENQFNLNYIGTGEKRDYVMASLVFYPQGSQEGVFKEDTLLVELWTGDTLRGPYLEELMKKIRSTVNWPVKLVFHPLGKNQEEMMSSDRPSVASMETDEIFKNRTYQILNPGLAYGYLRFLAGDESDDSLCLDQTSIAVFKKVPNDIGIVGGVITEEFQTPLSHINVKGINRGTINFALKDATTKLAAYKDKPVKIEVTATGYKITPISESEAAKQINTFWEKRRPKNRLVPEFLTNSHAPKDFLALYDHFQHFPELAEHQKLTKTIGAKAANVAFLSYLMEGPKSAAWGVLIPQAMAVPFDFYEEFMQNKQTGLDPAQPQRISTPEQMIQEWLTQDKLWNDEVHSFCGSKKTLAKIRSMIEKAKVPVSILNTFKKYVITEKNPAIHQDLFPKIRLRSSTNMEDLENFNGAGLYNSTGLSLYEEEPAQFDDRPVKTRPLSWEAIEKKLKKKIPYVYQSVWNDRAFEEREWFGIRGENHLKVKVGILLHQAYAAYDFDGVYGEMGNGVALSKNIYSEQQFYKILINGQHYDFAITNPPLAEDLKKRGENPLAPYRTEELAVIPFVADPVLDSRPDAWKGWPYEVLHKSSLKQQGPVLLDAPSENKMASQMEVRRLSKSIHYLSSQFAKLLKRDHEKFVLDLEWKVYGPNREIWIKQARPLSMQNKTF